MPTWPEEEQGKQRGERPHPFRSQSFATCLTTIAYNSRTVSVTKVGKSLPIPLGSNYNWLTAQTTHPPYVSG
jgi:hypothetical protein